MKCYSSNRLNVLTHGKCEEAIPAFLSGISIIAGVGPAAVAALDAEVPSLAEVPSMAEPLHPTCS